jgi:hypothetical protein
MGLLMFNLVSASLTSISAFGTGRVARALDTTIERQSRWLFEKPCAIRISVMREIPRKLNADDWAINPDVHNVQVFFKGKKEEGVKWYDLDAKKFSRLLMRDGRPVIENDSFVYETLSFKEGELKIKWIDESKVESSETSD